jgi:type 2 lantibiotic biosynthesis protein LanM
MQTLQKEFLEVAFSIGTRLCRSAIWSGEKCNWIGPSMEYVSNEWKVVQKAYGTDLYTGTGGIGYFLSRLYTLTGEEIIKKTAIGCFEQAIANKEATAINARVGLYTGWTGIVKAIQECGPILGRDDYSLVATDMLECLQNIDPATSGIDLLAGIAGAIPVFISQEKKQEEYLNSASQLADHLIAIASKSAKGWSWNTLISGSAESGTNLTGFSHGTAGIGWSLAELYHVTHNKRYLEAALQAFEYERHRYSAEYRNWPDLRDNENRQPAGSEYGSIAWCHGAPGIGLSRLRSYKILTDEHCRREAEIAVLTTRDMISRNLTNTRVNFSLCHGIGGNTELLLKAGEILGDEDLLQFSNEVGVAGARMYNKNGHPWPCGIIGAAECPGLMLGTAGIGYFYLRLCKPAEVPSILLPQP